MAYIVSRNIKRKKEFFVIPCYENVKTKGRKNHKLVERTLYIRKNRLYLLLREVMSEKKNYRKIASIIKHISESPSFVVG